MVDWVKSLSAAIVLQAVKDYEKCCKDLKKAKNKGNTVEVDKIKHEMRKIIDFVGSEWFAQLTNIAPDKIFKHFEIYYNKIFNEKKDI